VYNINFFYFSYNNNLYIYYTKNKKMIKVYTCIKYDRINWQCADGINKITQNTVKIHVRE
jgi:hypothetical protein